MTELQDKIITKFQSFEEIAHKVAADAALNALLKKSNDPIAADYYERIALSNFTGQKTWEKALEIIKQEFTKL